MLVAGLPSSHAVANEWGDDVTLLACVECFQVEVLLWTSTEGNQHEVRSLRPQGGRRFCDVLHLGLILDFHYWSLIPVQDGPLGSYRGEETVLDRPFVLWFDAKADEKILEDSNLLLHQPVLTVSAQAKLGDLLQGLFVVNYRGIHFHRRIFNDEQRQEVVDALLVGTSSSSLFSPSAHARARIPYHRAEGEEDSLLEASETCMMILFCLFVFFFFFFCGHNQVSTVSAEIKAQSSDERNRREHQFVADHEGTRVICAENPEHSLLYGWVPDASILRAKSTFWTLFLRRAFCFTFL